MVSADVNSRLFLPNLNCVGVEGGSCRPDGGRASISGVFTPRTASTSPHLVWTAPGFPATCIPPRPPSGLRPRRSCRASRTSRTWGPDSGPGRCWRRGRGTGPVAGTASSARPLRCRTRDFREPEEQEGRFKRAAQCRLFSLELIQ